MRVDVQTSENWPAPQGQRYKCFLDGVDVTNEAVAADEETGMVTLLSRNEEGRLFCIGSGPDRHAATEERTGKVELRLVPTH